jgi:hypothetical protein
MHDKSNQEKRKADKNQEIEPQPPGERILLTSEKYSKNKKNSWPSQSKKPQHETPMEYTLVRNRQWRC